MHIIYIILILLCLLSPGLAEYAPNKVLIKMRPQFSDGMQSIGDNDNLPADVQAILNKHGQAKTGKVFGRNHSNNGGIGAMALSEQRDNPLDRWHTVEYPSSINVIELIKTLKNNSSVEFVQPAFIYKPIMTPNDPYYDGTYKQWHLPAINAPAGWDIFTGSSQTVIAIIDSGVQTDHPDLAAKIITGRKFVDGVESADPNPDPAMNGYYHGTVVAGLAAAIGNNGIGVAGVDWKAKIMPLNVFGPKGTCTFEDIARAITWAADNGAQIINMCLGTDVTPEILRAIFGNLPDAELVQQLENGNLIEKAAINYAYAKNAVVIVAAGNENKPGEDHLNLLAVYSNVISVGSLQKSNNISDFSTRGFGGKTVELVAPGEYMGSTSVSSSYTNPNNFGNSGTSYAAPLVSGLASLLKGVHPGLTNAQIRQILQETSDDLGASGKDDIFGYGRINMQKALTKTVADFLPPTGSFTINNGDLYTKIPTAALSIQYPDTVVSMNIKINGTARGWEPVSHNTKIGLGDDGVYMFSLQFRNIIGDTGEFTAEQILILDTMPPVVSSPKLDVPSTDIKNCPVVSWTSTDNAGSGVASHNIYWGMNSMGIAPAEYLPGSGSNFSYTPPACVENGIYYLRVQPIDALGNVGVWTTVLSYAYDGSSQDTDDVDIEDNKSVARIGSGGTGEKIFSYPNPFSPAAGRILKIAYEVKKAGWSTVAIYNIRGQKIWQTDDYAEAGPNNLVFWDGRDARRRLAGNGTYILLLMDENKKIIARGRLMLLD